MTVNREHNKRKIDQKERLEQQQLMNGWRVVQSICVVTLIFESFQNELHCISFSHKHND